MIIVRLFLIQQSYLQLELDVIILIMSKHKFRMRLLMQVLHALAT